nr:Chain A, SN4m [synthetic construct]
MRKKLDLKKFVEDKNQEYAARALGLSQKLIEEVLKRGLPVYVETNKDGNIKVYITQDGITQPFPP